MNGLKKCRIRAGITQAELSSMTGISIFTLQKYEQGKRNLRIAGYSTLEKIAEALEVEISELIGG